ncbi:MAG: GAF domain-containing protein [Thermoflexaceae bacterium]|nr:GAF domain-containing protein [Thermoflexaceae bacterium]
MLGWFGTATDIHERRIAALAEEVLANIGAATVTAPDAAALVSAIAACLVPALGDYCVVDIGWTTSGSNAGGAPRGPRARRGYAPPPSRPGRAASTTTTPRRASCARASRDRGARAGVVRATPGARCRRARVLARLNPRAYLALPLRAQGRVIGTLSLLTSGDGHEFTTEEVALAEEAARRTALAVSNARLNERTREAEQLYRTLLDAVPQVVWLAGPKGGAFYYNRRWREYTGDPRAPAALPRIRLPEDLPVIAERWKVSLETSAPFECEYRLRGRDGDLPLVPRARRAHVRWPGRTERLARHGRRHRGSSARRWRCSARTSSRMSSWGSFRTNCARPSRASSGCLGAAAPRGDDEPGGPRRLPRRHHPRGRAAAAAGGEHARARRGRGAAGGGDGAAAGATRDPAGRGAPSPGAPGAPSRSASPGLDAIEAQPTYFDQVLSNLLSNAEYSPPALPITVMADAEGTRSWCASATMVSASPTRKPPRSSAVLPLDADGGIGAGAGLGLAVCMRLIEAQAGVSGPSGAPRRRHGFGALRAVLADTD